MSCKDYLFVDKIKKRILLHQELPNSKRVASDEAKIIILLFFYKGVDPTSHFVFMSNSTNFIFPAQNAAFSATADPFRL